jgi:hypothetical protein
MTAYTHHTVPTEFLEASGIRFDYRRFGAKSGVPLVFLQHSWATSASTTRR